MYGSEQSKIMVQKTHSIAGSTVRLVCWILFGLLIVVPVLILLVAFPEGTLGFADLLAGIGDGLGLFFGPKNNDNGSESGRHG